MLVQNSTPFTSTQKDVLNCRVSACPRRTQCNNAPRRLSPDTQRSLLRALAQSFQQCSRSDEESWGRWRRRGGWLESRSGISLVPLAGDCGLGLGKRWPRVSEVSLPSLPYAKYHTACWPAIKVAWWRSWRAYSMLTKGAREEGQSGADETRGRGTKRG
uniref:Uncharacterized protein n=1 Tax=Coccidioides posadasii RMSCC 3488 TaxID=454284 RepID=A0A0J6FTV0_COCPO|nr:hypothetical protein CPAG_09102 [Coccidioides posadasii RMSCC 3488]